MTSKTSFCNTALLRKNITRCWPLWTFYTVVLLLTVFLPLFALCTAVRARTAFDSSINFERFSVLYMNVGVLVQLPYAVLCAGFGFGYLHKTRSAYMLHAFPLTRGVLFRTNLLCGLLFAAAPWLTVTLLGFAVLAPALGVKAAAYQLLRGGLIVGLQYLFFYGLAVLCMHTTGKTVNGVLRYLVLNFAAVLLYWLACLLLDPLLYGIRVSAGAAMVLSPAVKLLEMGLFGSGLSGWAMWCYLGCIAAVGIAMTAVSWLFYRKRQMESCGEAVAFGFLRPIFKYFLAVLGALCIGIPASTVAFGDIYDGARILPTLAFLLVGGFLGYFGAEMMLKRSARVFRGKVWIGFACFALVLVFGLSAARFDLFGIVRRVPTADKVASVEFSLGYAPQGVIPLTAAEDIDKMREIHRAALEDYSSIDQNAYYPDSDRLNLTYHLKNGSTIERTYLLTPQANKEAVWQLNALLRRGDLNRAYFERLHLENAGTVRVAYRDERDRYKERTLNTEEIRELNEKLLCDAQEGKLLAFSNSDGGNYSVYFELRDSEGQRDMFWLYIPRSATAADAYLRSIE